MFGTNKLEVHSKLLESISPLETSSLHCAFIHIDRFYFHKTKDVVLQVGNG